MQSLRRQLCVLLALVSLAFYPACERHHPDELAHHEPNGADHAGSHGADAKHDDHSHGAASPAAAPIGTPAEFFPAATPASSVSTPPPPR